MRAEVAQPTERGVDALWTSAAVVCLHAWRVVVAADGHADDPCLTQPLQRPGDVCAVAIGGRLGIEEIADMGENARMVGDGVLHGGAKRLTQPLAPLVAALRRETRQRWGEMVVAGHDDANGRRQWNR